MGRVLCTSDWHGCGRVAEQVFNYLKQDDTLYIIGDIIDRGDDGLDIMDAVIADARVKMLKGNHEEMMLEALPHVIKDIRELDYPEGWGYELWLQNGGRHTLSKYESRTNEDWIKYRKFLESLPTELEYTSPAGHKVILEHAGYTPNLKTHRRHDPLWDRAHFHDKWQGPDDLYVVHGHTPTQYMRLMYGYTGNKPLTANEIKHKYDWYDKKENIDPFALRYCSGHKFCVDLCTIVSEKVCLLNLDTFEEIYINEKGVCEIINDKKI